MNAWHDTQTNRALQSEHDVSRAYVDLIPQALPYHNERWKNWDAAIALQHAARMPRDTPILDAGACRDPKYPSPFLPALQRLGFQRLHGVNLDEGEPDYEKGICYQRGDITGDLPFADGYFSYVACLSVIEHGVDCEAFIDEMARIIAPGGKLFVSFDYWNTPIDVGDRMAFGAPVHVFDKVEVNGLLHHADRAGFSSGNFNPACKDRVVKWLGLEYTFANILLERR